MKRHIAIVLTAFLSILAQAIPASAACYDPREVIKLAKDPRNTTPVIVMHRGYWLHNDNEIPENSMGAFIAADRQCMPGIETDVRLSKDNVPVLTHDFKLGRTAYLPMEMRSTAWDPEKKTGPNPAVADLYYYPHWLEPGLGAAKLLIYPFKDGKVIPDNVSDYPIETVKSFYDNYIDNRMSVVVFLEFKDKKALPYVLEQLYKDRRDYNQGYSLKKLYATELTVIKFNANMFPTPSDYRGALRLARAAAGAPSDMPDPIAYPYYASNTLAELVTNGMKTNPNYTDPYTESIHPWIDDERIRIGVEINLKVKGGILQDYYDRAVASHKVSIGNYHAIPNYLRSNPDADPERDLPSTRRPGQTVKAKIAYYESEGTCCYELSDMLGTVWKGVKDSQDRRPDPDFIIGKSGLRPDFKIITTDDYHMVSLEIMRKGGRDALINPFYTSVLAGPIISIRGAADPKNALAEKKVHLRRLDPITKRWHELNTYPIDMLADSDQTMTPFNGNIYTYWAYNPTRHYGYRLDDDGKWRPLNAIGPMPLLSGSPGMITYDHKMYFFGASAKDHKLYYSVSTNGEQWSQAATVPDITLDASPRPVILGGRLYVFYRGLEGPGKPFAYKELYYTSMDYGMGRLLRWTPPKRVENVSLREDPGLFEYNNELFVFTHTDSNQHFMECHVFDGYDWTAAAKRVPNVKLLGSPTVSLYRGNPFIFYKDASSGELASVKMTPDDCAPEDFATQPEFHGVKMTGSPTAW